MTFHLVHKPSETPKLVIRVNLTCELRCQTSSLLPIPRAIFLFMKPPSLLEIRIKD